MRPARRTSSRRTCWTDGGAAARARQDPLGDRAPLQPAWFCILPRPGRCGTITAGEDPSVGRGSAQGPSGDDVRGSRSGCGCITWTIVVLAAIAVRLAVTFLWIVPSVRKSYTIDSVDIRATVRADGALNATERFSYTFHGPYTCVYRDIPWEGYRSPSWASMGRTVPCDGCRPAGRRPQASRRRCRRGRTPRPRRGRRSLPRTGRPATTGSPPARFRMWAPSCASRRSPTWTTARRRSPTAGAPPKPPNAGRTPASCCGNWWAAAGMCRSSACGPWSRCRGRPQGPASRRGSTVR